MKTRHCRGLLLFGGSTLLLFTLAGCTLPNPDEIDLGNKDTVTQSATFVAESTEVVPTPEAPSENHGLYPNYEIFYNSEEGIWEVHNLSGATVAKWTEVPTNPDVIAWVYDQSMLATDERINIFDANSFPELFTDFANNWLEAQDWEWARYQRFIEASRQAFFESVGIADEALNLDEINPDLRSLWGMIYWVQHNRGYVISEELTPVVTPAELRIIMEDEPSFSTWVEWKTLSDGRVANLYGIDFVTGPSWYNSQDAGDILGRPDINVPRDPASGAINGDEAILARVFPNDPNTLIVLVHTKAPPESDEYPYRHALFAGVVTFDENFTIPAGEMCSAARIGETVRGMPLPRDLLVGGPSHFSGSTSLIIDRNSFFGVIGANIIVAQPSFINKPYSTPEGNLYVNACIDPQTGMEIIGKLQPWLTDDDGIARRIPERVWPWQASAE